MSDKYSYDPTDPDDVEKMGKTKATYHKMGWTFDEIPDPDVPGKFWVVFTEPEAPGPAPSPPPSTPTGQLAWGAKVSSLFRDKVRNIAKDLGCDADFLMAAMAFETGETFGPSIRNAAGSGATGLIQFMPSTARGLGTTTDDLASMTAEDQLDFVAEYFANQKGRLHTLEDVYMAILLPSAVGKSNDHVLFSSPSRAYDQNKGLDLNGDGRITKAEAAAKVQAKLDKGRLPGNIG